MPLNVSALGSLSSSLDDLTSRLEHLSRELGPDDDLGAELRDVHRQLEASGRRLTAILRQASRSL